MKSISLLVFNCLLLALAGCSDHDDTVNVCSESIVCTLELRSFHVSVSDTNGKPLKLDAFEVRDTKSNQNLTIAYSLERLRLMQNANSYYLFGDLWAKDYVGRTTVIRFRGFQNNKEIVSAEFEVGADCCHAILISGNTELVIT